MMAKVLRLSRPLYLLYAALAYLLGAGLARYLGAALRPAAFILGLLCTLLLQFTASLLAEYFRSHAEPLTEDETPSQRAALRTGLMQTSIAGMALVAAFTLSMLFTGLMLLPGLLLALIAVLLVAWAVPPFRLVYSGYGELVLAILWANLLPAFAFILQTGEIHRILPLITLPLTFLALACLLVSSFPTFAADQHYARRTLLTRLTWQRAVPLHHFLLAAAYLLFTAAPLFGFPWSLLWPAYLTLPGAVAQGIWLQRIAQGGRTLWKSYMVLAAAVFGLTIYFLALTSWIR